MDKYQFIAKKVNFQGEEGYMVSQLRDGEAMCKQFVPEKVYKKFCKAINMIPKIVE